MVSNLLTAFRIIAAPIIWLIFALGEPQALLTNLFALLLFLLAALTDWLDGFWARKYGQTTEFGQFIDPLADKLLIATLLILLVALGRIDALWAILIIIREIAMSGMREWLARLGASEVVAVSWLGKVKTATQMIAMVLLLSVPIYNPSNLFFYAGQVALIASVVLSWVSFIQYIKRSYHLFTLR